MNITDYAEQIFASKPIILNKTQDLHDRIHQISESMFNNDRQSHGRTFEQILSANKQSVAEFALEQHCPSLVMNQRPWSKTDPLSYAYDNVDLRNNKTFEIKRWPKNQPNGKMADWFSYPEDALGTLHRNISLVDYVLSGKIIEHPEYYEVGFHMIADGPSFFKYMKRSMYKSTEMVYYHTNAMRDGNCIRNMNVTYGDQHD